MRSALTRRRMATLPFAATLLLLAARTSPSALADPAGVLEVQVGAGAAQRLTPEELGRFPVTGVEVPVPEGHGTGRIRYAGVLLWTLLNQAGLEGMQARERVRQVVTVTGQDGYAAVLALGEIDPAFEGKQVLIATAADGRPIGASSLRLVVPGDRRGGRSVRDVVRIEVR
jgi:hypothetical protein